MSAPATVLGAVLRESAIDEGGIRALARTIGISPQTLYDLLGGHVPSRHVCRTIATYLEITPHQVAAWAREAA